MAANVKISQLQALSTVLANSSIPIVQNGVTSRANLTTILADTRANDYNLLLAAYANDYATYVALAGGGGGGGGGGADLTLVYANDLTTYLTLTANIYNTYTYIFIF